jgi:hypothetical protein
MYAIGHRILQDYKQNLRPLLCCLNDSYLLGDRKQRNSPWYFILIDNELKQHEQKFLSNYGIINIAVVKYSANESMLAIYRERECVDRLTHDRSKLVLELYKI